MRFVDSNIPIYAIASNRADRKKSEQALRILEEGDFATSVQVLQEFYVQATRATRPRPLPHDSAVGPSFHMDPVSEDMSHAQKVVEF